MKWNVILCSLSINNRIIPSNNQPLFSGEYLCTCVRSWVDDNGVKQIHRYLRMMAYNKEKNLWHDIGNSSGISHNILAWASGIDACDFRDFDLFCGVPFEKDISVTI